LSIQGASVTQTISPTAFNTNTGTYTPSISITVSTSLTNTITTSWTSSNTYSTSATISNTISTTMSVTTSQLAAINKPIKYAAPPGFTNTCPNAHTIACPAWGNDGAVYFDYFLLSIVVANSGNTPSVFNITGNTYSVTLESLATGTTYTLTLQGFLFQTPSAVASITVVTLTPDVKMNPALGITGLTCQIVTVTAAKKNQKRKNMICKWTNGVVGYSSIDVKIKCDRGQSFDKLFPRSTISRTIYTPTVVTSFTISNFNPKFVYKCTTVLIPAYMGVGERRDRIKTTSQG